ncbi:MAG TPA: hypothetical protein VE974_12255 [Thermoanaerobaculia bacterium]|nr:hypothetical protein [Thermoanaerobaculia bacterium]
MAPSLRTFMSSMKGRLRDHDLRAIERLVIAHRLEFIEAWNDFFGN